MSFAAILRRTLTWVNIVSLLPIAVAVAGSGYLTYRYNKLLSDTQARVAESLQVTTAIDDLMLDLVNVETGQRGYLITGDEDYLEPYQAATAQLSTEFERLQTLIAGRPEQMASLDRIAQLSEQKLAELGATIRIRRNVGFAAARAIVASDAGKDEMDRIRVEVDTMRQRETTRLAAYAVETRETERRVVLVVAACILITIVGRIVSLMIPVIWRHRSRGRNRADR